jgi:hypothetical protein
MTGDPHLTDEQLRALVRDAVARHLGHPASALAAGPPHAVASSLPGSGAPPAVRLHASHARYVLTPGGDTEGACLIEPAVRCNHCGYCQSHGH